MFLIQDELSQSSFILQDSPSLKEHLPVFGLTCKDTHYFSSHTGLDPNGTDFLITQLDASGH